MYRIDGIFHPHPNLPPSRGKGLWLYLGGRLADGGYGVFGAAHDFAARQVHVLDVPEGVDVFGGVAAHYQDVGCLAGFKGAYGVCDTPRASAAQLVTERTPCMGV